MKCTMTPRVANQISAYLYKLLLVMESFYFWSYFSIRMQFLIDNSAKTHIHKALNQQNTLFEPCQNIVGFGGHYHLIEASV